jgi:hypothetical protein
VEEVHVAAGVARNNQFKSLGKGRAIRHAIADEGGEHFCCFHPPYFPSSDNFQIGQVFFQPMWGVLKTIGIVIVVFIAIYTIFDLLIHRRD